MVGKVALPHENESLMMEKNGLTIRVMNLSFYHSNNKKRGKEFQFGFQGKKMEIKLVL